MDKIKELSAEALANLATEKRAAFDALIALEAPTADQVDEAETLASEIEQISAEQQRRDTASQRFADLKDRFSENTEEETSEEETSEGEETEEQAREEVSEEASEETEEAAEEGKRTAARGKVKSLAKKTSRPETPQQRNGMVTITAAADVPEFATGSTIEGIDQIGQALINRMRGFSPPRGNGETEDLRHFGVASIHRPFEKELTIDRGSDDMEVLAHAAKESRLDGGSLVAAGGWCSPSETLYDLTAPETTEGLISVPEVNVKRGGINFTLGPDFADFFSDANGRFVQTEAQAIAGTTKPCVTVDCPAFQEVRLDATGLCIKIPILTNATYPELVQRYVSGFLTAYQHKVSQDVLNRMLALSPAPRVLNGLGSSVDDTLEGLTLIADQERQRRRLSMSHTLEVILPFWVKNMFKADIRRRTQQNGPVSDQQVTSEFSAQQLNPQFIYNWQDLALADVVGPPAVDAEAYPATFDVLMYPAGTFVKGTSDVINLSAVYDAASLAENVYTGMFMEEGLLVAHMGFNANRVTVPVCNAGRRGAQDVTCP